MILVETEIATRVRKLLTIQKTQHSDYFTNTLRKEQLDAEGRKGAQNTLKSMMQ